MIDFTDDELIFLIGVLLNGHETNLDTEESEKSAYEKLAAQELARGLRND